MSTSRTSEFPAALPWLLFLTTLVFMVILPRLLLAPLLLRVSESFGISYGRASGFFITGSFGFVTGLFTSGFIANRLRHKLTIVTSIGLAGASLIGLSFASSFAMFHAFFFLSNWASGLYPGSGIASVTSIAPDSHRGAALAIHESGPNLAFLSAPVLVAILAPHLGWRGVLQIAGATSLLLAGVFALFGRASLERGQPPHFANVQLFLRNRPFWVISVLFMVAASGAMGVFSVLPTYLMVEHALSEQLVNTVVGVSRITGFATILIAGTMVDRYGFAPVVAVVLGTTGVVTLLLGLVTGTPLLVAVFLQPMMVASFFPLGLSALSDVAPPQARNLAVALAIPLANLVGGGLMPRLITWAGELGYFHESFVVLGAATVASLLLLRLVPELHKPAST